MGQAGGDRKLEIGLLLLLLLLLLLPVRCTHTQPFTSPWRTHPKDASGKVCSKHNVDCPERRRWAHLAPKMRFFLGGNSGRQERLAQSAQTHLSTSLYCEGTRPPSNGGVLASSAYRVGVLCAVGECTLQVRVCVCM